ncbi:hypothetical protein [Priestia megaterium]|uniref:hypothetical protein n=1 Tax=Priestia megaterium TaxID=1404 RepID=UPI0018678E37|nr:hypothetical protein [Priestia megaterium]MBE2977757.1 hypothetical protein [Priestia megaterium]
MAHKGGNVIFKLLLIIAALGFILFSMHLGKVGDEKLKVQAKAEAAKEKRIEAEQAKEEKKEAEIWQKQLKLASAYLKLPEENVTIDGYDNDFGDYDEGEIYTVIAKGVEYEVSFNQAITKVDKFVQMPSDDSEYCSGSSTDSDSGSAHFPKIKTKSSSKKR